MADNNKISDTQLKQLIEASLFVLGKPLTIKFMRETVLAGFSVSRARIQAVVNELQQDYQERGVQLVKVASGYRFQTLEMLNPLLQPLWQEKAPKYSRAVMETLAVIAYRQPVTRGDIEQIRGVAISSHIIKTLADRHWVKVVGHKDVPGRPALYATTNTFLSYFGLNRLADLPPLSDIESLQAMFERAQQAPEPANDAESEAPPTTIEESTNE
ncbi:SMC-Scp complex subunit ScpB [Shewanella sp. WXL01]|uniref:SMC-Scp complex subunit ScpB n=1 Tax=Shewanella sp. WXL01 TaxID=2709721 RepID=UPI0014384F13|nr:SMC-Scp complex subunit ScpB [Shewanella sp. WXL01]NKF50300.1 SMC-Scp complex subunit ScpB [Shewanella sp. WXL01]